MSGKANVFIPTLPSKTVAGWQQEKKEPEMKSGGDMKLNISDGQPQSSRAADGDCWAPPLKSFDRYLDHRERGPTKFIPHGVKQQQWKRSEEHTSELQSLMRISSAVFCLKKKT